MPGISHLTGTSAAITNYLQNKRLDGLTVNGEPVSAKNTGYYDRGSSAPAEWHGQGAALLGLAGEVDNDDFGNLLEGRINGIDVSERGGIKEGSRRKATDLTFKAPKSVSLLALVHGDKRLVEAHTIAVKAALNYIEDQVIYVRRGKAGVIRENTDNLTAALFLHEDSRAIDGKADPLLHTHAVVANITLRNDGEWAKLKLDFGHFNEKLHLSGDHYYSTLAREIKKLGYEIERKGDNFEIAGVPEKSIDAFSRRSAAIEDALAEKGLSRETASAKDKTAATMATRNDKTQLTRSEQLAEWRQRARDLDIDFGQVFDESQKPKDCSTLLDSSQITENAIRSAVRHLSERNTVFSQNQVESEALRASYGDCSALEISKAIQDGAGGLVFAGEVAQRGGMSSPRADKQYTSDLAILREAEILARAKEGRGTVAAVMDAEKATQAIEVAEIEQGFTLSGGQKEAISLAITSVDRHIGVVGAAGAGKTTSMRVIVDEFREAGYEIIGVAPSSKAAIELRSAGCDETLTLAKALISQGEAPEKPRLYMLDEAGMVSARDYAAFFELVERDGGRSISVGDYRQLSSVEAGSPFEQLTKSESMDVAVIDEIQRQKNEQLLAVVQHFATGDAAGGVKLAQPFIVQDVDFTRKAAEKYLSLDVGERDQTIMMTTTNVTRQAVNDEIRAALRDRGAIGKTQIQLLALDKVDFTREEYRRADKYEPGMILRLSHSIKSDDKIAEAKTDLIVKSRNRGTLTVVDKDDNEYKVTPRNMHIRAYRAKIISLSEGDKIVFRDNDKTLKTENGFNGIIKYVDVKSGSVKINVHGREIELNNDRTAAIDYAYCRTTHSAQGATFDRAIIIGESAKVATAELAYVGISRARHNVDIYTDDAEKLSGKWRQWGEKKTALESINAKLAQKYMTTSDELVQKRRAAEKSLHHEHKDGDITFASDMPPNKTSSVKIKKVKTVDERKAVIKDEQAQREKVNAAALAVSYELANGELRLQI